MFSFIYLPKEHEAQYLALCPLCAAKYQEFIKNDDTATAMTRIRNQIVDADSAQNCCIPITLGDEETSIRFVETHLHDLQLIVSMEGDNPTSSNKVPAEDLF